MLSIDEISEKAYRQEGLEEINDILEEYMYMKLLKMYIDYREKRISKEKCIKIKNELRKDYKGAILERQRAFEICKEYNDNRRIATENLHLLNKTQDKDEALEYSLILLETFLQDDTLRERILKNIRK